MAATKKTDRQRTRKQIELRFDMGRTPPPWRRFVIAGAAICHSIQVLAHTNPTSKGEDEHDST